MLFGFVIIFFPSKALRHVAFASQTFWKFPTLVEFLVLVILR